MSIYSCYFLLNTTKMLLNTVFKGTHFLFTVFILSLDVCRAKFFSALPSSRRIGFSAFSSNFATLHMFTLNKMRSLIMLKYSSYFWKQLVSQLPCVCLFASLVLPAWRMAAFEREETANVLRGGSDWHRLREALLLLPHFLWSRD